MQSLVGQILSNRYRVDSFIGLLELQERAPGPVRGGDEDVISAGDGRGDVGRAVEAGVGTAVAW